MNGSRLSHSVASRSRSKSHGMPAWTYGISTPSSWNFPRDAHVQWAGGSGGKLRAQRAFGGDCRGLQFFPQDRTGGGEILVDIARGSMMTKEGSRIYHQEDFTPGLRPDVQALRLRSDVQRLFVSFLCSSCGDED